MTPSRWLLAGTWCALLVFGVLAWSTAIGDDAPWPEDPPPPPPVFQLLGGKARGLVKARPGPPRELMPVDPAGGLDHRTFMLAFKRQADLELIQCLRGWESTPGSVAVSGVLDKQGRLRHLTSLDPARPLPSCAEEALAAMTFPASGQQLRRPTVVLQWRIDW